MKVVGLALPLEMECVEDVSGDCESRCLVRLGFSWTVSASEDCGTAPVHWLALRCHWGRFKRGSDSRSGRSSRGHRSACRSIKSVI